MATYVTSDTDLTSIADAIRSKGGTSDSLTYPTGFVNAIDAIPTGGGGGGEELSGATFYDYDGIVLYEYTKEQFAQLTSMPALPTHTGLIAEEWNYTLSDAKSYVENQGWLAIGATCVTASGATEIDIDLPTGWLSPYIGIGLNGSASIDWGDGSAASSVSGSSISTVINTQHTYAAAGKYTISISILSGTASIRGNGNYYSQLVWANITTSPYYNNYVYRQSIRAIRLGRGITTIGTFGLYHCDTLKEITLPTNITDISADSMAYSGLKFIVIPTSAGTNMGLRVFNYCYSLEGISLPNTLMHVNLFSNCINLAQISIPYGVTSTNGLITVNSLKHVTIPSTVTVMSGPYGSNLLRHITFPDNVTEIGAISSNMILESLIIPANVTKLLASCFAYNRGLKGKIILPVSVTDIRASIFDGCTGVEEIDMSACVNMTDFKTYAGQCSGCNSLKEFYFPPNANKIPDNFFYNCYSLQTIHWPTSPSSIGGYAFYNCRSIEKIDIPSTITTIGSYAFYGCSMLSEITLHEGVTTIGTNAFRDNPCLTGMTIPSTVTAIGAYSFINNYSMGYLDMSALNSVPTLNGSGLLTSTPAGLKIYVKNSLLTQFQTASNWSVYASQMVGV